MHHAQTPPIPTMGGVSYGWTDRHPKRDPAAPESEPGFVFRFGYNTPMTDTIINVFFIAIVALAVLSIFLLDRRVRTRGRLFFGQFTPASRILAFLMSLVLGLWAAYDRNIEFGLLSVALFAYAIGQPFFLERLQNRAGQPPTSQDPAQQRRRFWKRLAVRVLLLSLAGMIVFGAIWLGSHDPISGSFTAGLLVVALLVFFSVITGIIGVVSIAMFVKETFLKISGKNEEATRNSNILQE
jgi:hypothetical protein